MAGVALSSRVTAVSRSAVLGRFVEELTVRLLGRAAGNARSTIARGVVERQYISIITVLYLVDNKRVGHVDIHIDYDRHRVNIGRAGSAFSIDFDSSVTPQISRSLEELLKVYTHLREQAQVEVRLQWTWRPGINTTEARAWMNSSPAEIPEWYGGQAAVDLASCRDRELGELDRIAGTNLEPAIAEIHHTPGRLDEVTVKGQILLQALPRRPGAKPAASSSSRTSAAVTPSGPIVAAALESATSVQSGLRGHQPGLHRLASPGAPRSVRIGRDVPLRPIVVLLLAALLAGATLPVSGAGGFVFVLTATLVSALCGLRWNERGRAPVVVKVDADSDTSRRDNRFGLGTSSGLARACDLGGLFSASSTRPATDSPAVAVAVSIQRLLAIAGYASGAVAMTRLEVPGTTRVLGRHSGGVRSVAWSPRLDRAISGGADGTVASWNLFAGREAWRAETHDGPISGVAYGHQGSLVATGGEDGVIKVLAAWSGRERLAISPGRGPMRSVSFTPSGRHIVSLSADGVLDLWDTASGRKAPFESDARPIGVVCVLISPDGSQLLCFDSAGTATIRDTRSGEVLIRSSGHGLALTADGSPGLSRDGGRGRALAALDAPRLAWSPDGKRVASAGADGRLTVWDASSLEVIGEADLEAPTIACGFHPSEPTVWSVEVGCQEKSMALSFFVLGEPPRTQGR